LANSAQTAVPCPRLNKLLENTVQAFRDVPVRVALPHFANVADVANMVTRSSLFRICPLCPLPRQSLNAIEGF